MSTTTHTHLQACMYKRAKIFQKIGKKSQKVLSSVNEFYQLDNSCSLEKKLKILVS
jgi:hypothetical protein